MVSLLVVERSREFTTAQAMRKCIGRSAKLVRLSTGATIALGLAARLSLAEVPDYKLGETAREEIITPLALVVIDPEQTAALKQKEASRVPVLCRYYTNAPDEAEKELRGVFAGARNSFLDRVESAFKHRALDAQSVTNDEFQKLVVSFLRQNKAFPLTTNLAELWARGESDRAILDSMAAALREAMAYPLRPPNIPNDVRFGATVRLVPLANWTEMPTLADAEQRGINFSRSNIVTWTRARDTLLESFPIEQRATAKFIVSFLKTNCVPDVELTRAARELRTEPIWAADRYEPGQVLAKQGQVIDKKVLAALSQWRKEAASASLALKVREDRLQTAQSRARLRWAAAGGLVLGAILGVALWRRRRRGRRSLLPARMAGDGAGATVVACPSCAETIVVPEDSARRAAPSGLPPALAPHLAKMLMDKFVRKLLSQRTGMLDTQAKATAEMAEMEVRLEKIQAPLQERLRAYEQRIGELEKELAQKGEENRELIKLKIALVRNQLAATKDQLEMN